MNVTNKDGRISQFVVYLPFGETLYEEHSNTRDMPYKFNGKEKDEETGLYYYGARYYDPWQGQFYGSDPLKSKYPSLGSYTYCANNPVILVDPTGMSIEDPPVKTIELKEINIEAKRPNMFQKMQYKFLKITNDFKTFLKKHDLQGSGERIDRGGNYLTTKDMTMNHQGAGVTTDVKNINNADGKINTTTDNFVLFAPNGTNVNGIPNVIDFTRHVIEAVGTVITAFQAGDAITGAVQDASGNGNYTGSGVIHYSGDYKGSVGGKQTYDNAGDSAKKVNFYRNTGRRIDSINKYYR